MEKKSSSNLSMILMIALGIIVVILGIAAFYFYNQYQQIKKNPNQVAQAETDALVSQVSKLIDLPKDETPTVATVIDKDKLKDQPFFASAQNGDKILIYTKAKKAIVFRPSQNKLINVGPIAIDQGVSVAIVNAGGDATGAQNTLSSKLGTSISISGITNAANSKNVKQLTVVDVSGQNADLAKQVAQALGGTVGAMPTGETAPSGASIVVFVK